MAHAGSPIPLVPKSMTAARRPSATIRFPAATSPWNQTGGKADGQLVPETERPVVVTARHHEFDVELGPLRELLRHQSRGEFDRQALGICHGRKAYGKGDDP